MLIKKDSSTFNIRSTEFRLSFLLFIVLWVYLIIRANYVFYIFDEIFTKWNYMVHWNPFPNQGIVDANNHFLLSLVGGFFTRLFHSDSMFVIRLGSLLAFPVYFWSIFGLKNHFRQKWNFYAFLIALTTTSFLIEFFSMARGYGLALAFLMLALQQMMSYINSDRKRALIGSLFGWLLAVYASLTLLPIALIAIFYLCVYTLKRKFYFGVLPIAITIIPFYYLINYSFTLKDMGKLYYGGALGFFSNTVHSLTKYLWHLQNNWFDAILVLIACFILFVTLKRLWVNKNLFDPKLIFSFFLFIAIASILGQHWLLGVNYPEDRTAIYLIVFFFGGLFFALDEFSNSKWGGLISIGLSLIFFAFTMNFSHTMLFVTEHLDQEIVKNIPLRVNGTPPTIAGKWNMESELTRKLDLPFRVYQNFENPYDTLVDYVVVIPERRQDLVDLYDVIHLDKISGQALMKRKKFLNRSKITEVSHQIIDQAEFQTFYISTMKEPLVIRCTGKFEEMTKEKEIFIVFSSQDSLSGQQYTYEVVPMVRNKKINNAGELAFDFSYAMNALDGANSFAVYLWNQNREELHGKIKLEVYALDE